MSQNKTIKNTNKGSYGDIHIPIKTVKEMQLQVLT